MPELLIVDDEMPLLRNLSSYLGSFPEFTVHTSSTAEDALAALRERPEIDIVLTDVRLPGMDGVTLIREAAAFKPQLKFLVMTAYPSREIRRKAASAGALRYLGKPLDLSRLRELLLEVDKEGDGWSGSVGGLDIFDFTQLFAMSGKTTALRVRHAGEDGVLVFREGSLVHASSGELEGDDAFYHLTNLQGGTFQELPRHVAETYARNVRSSISHLMMESARRRDERLAGRDDDEAPAETAPGDEARDAAFLGDDPAFEAALARALADDDEATAPEDAPGPAGSGAGDDGAAEPGDGEAAGDDEAVVRRALAGDGGNGPITLRDVGLPRLTRLACDQGGALRAHLRLGESEAELFYSDRALVHAAMGSQVGEEVVYAVLTWDDAELELELGAEAPEVTITRDWSNLFLRAFGEVRSGAGSE